MRFLLVAYLVACSHPAPRVDPPVADPTATKTIDVENLEAQLPPYLESVAASEPFSALSGYLLVAQHGKPVFSRAFGWADRARKLQNTADTSFRIGSVTKQFTAAAILALEQAGKLSVTDKVSAHLHDYPGPGKDVTIHQLLTHTAGIPNYTADPAILARKNEHFTTAQLLATFWNQPLEFTPGAQFKYSNSGYVVLGAIIERASGKSYAAYLQQTLFAPAGMTRTVVGDAAGVTDRAEGYQLAGEVISSADPIDMSLPFAAGAVRSTANDLVRWHAAISGDLILKAPARTKLYTPERENYAYGWVVQDIAGRRTIWHNGGIDGFSTILWRIPDADVVVVGWSNVLGVEADPLGRAAIEAALGQPVKPIPKRELGIVDPLITVRVVGEFVLTDEAKAILAKVNAPAQLVESILTLTITASPAALILKPVGQGEVSLSPLADGSWFNRATNIVVRYTVPASGLVPQVTLQQGGLELTYQRVK